MQTTSLLITLVTLFSFALNANSLEGTVTYSGNSSKGVLFVFAKKHDGSMPMPLAVKRVANPKFPYKFKLSAADKMIPSLPFEGPFKITARLTKSGDVMDKSGPEATTTKAHKKGDKEIKLELK